MKHEAERKKAQDALTVLAAQAKARATPSWPAAKASPAPAPEPVLAPATDRKPKKERESRRRASSDRKPKRDRTATYNSDVTMSSLLNLPSSQFAAPASPQPVGGAFAHSQIYVE